MKIIFAFVLGGIIGSFLNVCIYRIPKNLSIVKPNSFCPVCKKPIDWFYNMPIISYIILAGKCRNCGKPISIRYLIVELITAILFLLLFLRFDFSLEFISAIILFCFLIVMAFIDFDRQLIFDRTTYPLAVIGLILSFFLPGRYIVGSLIGMLVGGLSLYMVGLLSLVFFKKEGMGFGDVKLAGAIGTFLGWKEVLASLILAFFIGAIVGIVLIILRKKGRKEYIPFGPFIALGGVLMTLWGNEIIKVVMPIFQIYE